MAATVRRAGEDEQPVNTECVPLMNGLTLDDDDEHRSRESSSTAEDNWGFPITELYKLALTFHKEKEGKALYLSYDEKLQLVARSQQVLHGPCSDQIAAPQVGYLDVIGRDRRQAWNALGNASKEEAMRGFVRILDEACPIFRPYVEAHKRDLEEKERLMREEEERRMREAAEEEEQRQAAEETCQRQQLELRRLELQRQQIQEALNQQTSFQFQAYARQQFPNDSDRQSSLIRQLQEQHYQQYVQQVYQQQQLDLQQKSQMTAAASSTSSSSTPLMDDNRNRLMATTNEGDDCNDETGGEAGSAAESNASSRSQTPDPSSVKPASMWTRKDIVDFKNSVTGEEGGGDSVIRVGHGETVTVRVPTHEDGTCLFWEFATDGYDIGFGVYFEWTETPGTQVSVHVSESEDDEDEDEGGGGGGLDDGGLKNGDVERGVPMPPSSSLGLAANGAESSPPLTIIIPIYRRDCHEEVYAGSHVYPGQGVYLLKFDNSYSLWRSKTLYYRVYYTH